MTKRAELPLKYAEIATDNWEIWGRKLAKTQIVVSTSRRRRYDVVVRLYITRFVGSWTVWAEHLEAPTTWSENIVVDDVELSYRTYNEPRRRDTNLPPSNWEQESRYNADGQRSAPVSSTRSSETISVSSS